MNKQHFILRSYPFASLKSDGKDNIQKLYNKVSNLKKAKEKNYFLNLIIVSINVITTIETTKIKL